MKHGHDDAAVGQIPPLTILGTGYVGRALRARFPHAVVTRRRADPDAGIVRFDLADEASWAAVPFAGHHVVMTFPAEPLEAVQRWYARCMDQAVSLIVLGSTSAYRLPVQAGMAVVDVDESCPLDLDRPRVVAEEWLRGRGATILQLAGIFGPHRQPADWLARGRIADGAKFVNLIHVDDIVAVIARLLATPQPDRRFNLANGDAIAWRDLAARLIPGLALAQSHSGEHGKRIRIDRLRGLLPGHRFARP